jgi:hypothetical protein
MTSPALATWRSSRLPRLDRLLALHPDSAGSATDPAVAEVCTHALVSRLASQFQGFCRDLHDDAVNAILDAVAVSDEEMRGMLTNGLTVGRGLDRRSADPKTVDDDFARLGADQWVGLAAVRPEAVSSWREGLGALHRARNGVAHDDRDAIAAVAVAGWPVRVDTVRKWRNLLDDTAEGIDTVASKEISRLIGKNPWG